MAGATLSTIDAILKDMYGPKIVDQFQNDIPLLLFAQKNDKVPFVGRKFVVPIKVGRNQGMQFVAEGGQMPGAGNQKYTDVTVAPAYWYGRYGLTAQALEMSRNDQGAFARAMTKEAQGLVEDMSKRVNQGMYLNQAGVRGTVSSIASSTITLTGPSKGLEVDMKVDVYSSDYATKRNSTDLIITATTDAGLNDTAITTLTFSGTASGITANDVVVLKGSISGGAGIGFIGLQSAVAASGTYLGVDPSTYGIWKANVLTNGGTKRSISEDLIQQALDVTRQRSGKKPDFLITTYNLRRRFYNSLAPNRRFVNTKKLVAGAVELVDYDGTDFLVDPDAPNYTLFGLTKDTWNTVQTRDGHWIDDDGKILHRALDDSDSYFATWRWFCQLATEQRNAQFQLGDLTE
jgi:hypothetical protein